MARQHQLGMPLHGRTARQNSSHLPPHPRPRCHLQSAASWQLHLQSCADSEGVHSADSANAGVAVNCRKQKLAQATQAAAAEEVSRQQAAGSSIRWTMAPQISSPTAARDHHPPPCRCCCCCRHLLRPASHPLHVENQPGSACSTTQLYRAAADTCPVRCTPESDCAAALRFPAAALAAGLAVAVAAAALGLALCFAAGLAAWPVLFKNPSRVA